MTGGFQCQKMSKPLGVEMVDRSGTRVVSWSQAFTLQATAPITWQNQAAFPGTIVRGTHFNHAMWGNLDSWLPMFEGNIRFVNRDTNVVRYPPLRGNFHHAYQFWMRGTSWQEATPWAALPVGRWRFEMHASNGWNGWQRVRAHDFVVVPIPPPNLRSSAQTHNSITLNWNVSPGATGYRIYRDTWTHIRTVSGGNTTSVTITGLATNTQHNFRVVATHPAGNSYGSMVSVRTGGAGGAPPATAPPSATGGGGGTTPPVTGGGGTTGGSNVTTIAQSNDIQYMVRNIRNSSHVPDRTRASAAAAAGVLLNNGFEPAFVAGMVSNIVSEGRAGLFENSNYRSNPAAKPDYLRNITSWLNYGPRFSNQYIYNLDFHLFAEIASTVSMLHSLNWRMPNWNINYGQRIGFGLGMCQWTFHRTYTLMNVYREFMEGRFVITERETLSAESELIRRELSPGGLHARVHPNWRSANGNNLNSSNAAFSAGDIICRQYLVPANTSYQAQRRGDRARSIFADMMGTPTIVAA